MNYLSSCYWRQEDLRTSLVLKHLVYPGGDEPVLLGCLCREKTGAAFIRSFTEWFYKEGLYLCKKKGSDPEWLRQRLEGQIAVLLQEEDSTGTFSASVILCVGSYFVLWNRGRHQVCLLNTRFGRPRLRCLAGDGETAFPDSGLQGPGEIPAVLEECLAGELQESVGILLGTEDLYETISPQELASCLVIGELNCQDRVDRRLKELGEEAYRRGGEHTGAMLIVTCPK